MQAAAVKRISILGITLLIVLVPFGGYYLSYVSSQRDYYRTKNFRVLNAIAKQIASRLKGISLNVQNASDKAASDLCDTLLEDARSSKDSAIEKRPRTRRPPAQSGTAAAAHASAGLKKSEKLGNLFANLGKTAHGRAQLMEILEAKLKTALAPISEQSGAPLEYMGGTLRVVWNAQETAGKSASESTGPSLSMRLDSDERVIYLTCSHQSTPAFSFEVKCKLSRNKSKDGLLDPIIKRYVFDEISDGHDHLFEAVLVADQDDGKVIFQLGRVPLTLANLNGLVSAGDGKNIDTHQNASTAYNVRLAGSDYKLFMEPLRLPVLKKESGPAAHTEFTVVGLLGEDRFSKETLSISYNFLLGVAGILLLSCMSWPLLKVLLMGPKDRLRTVDVLGVCISALMSVALVTLVALDLHAYSALDDTANQSLREFGDRINSNTGTELGAVRRQLVILSGAQKPDYGDPAPRGKSVSILSPESQSGMKPLGDSSVVPYPTFDEANLINSRTGQQQFKWTTRSDTSSYINVFDRKYFQEARDIGFGFEPINSRSSSKKMAVVSIPVDGGAGVLAMGTRLLSLFDTVNPPGFGFAVVNEEGLTQFHSDPQKNGEEKMLEECSEALRLRAAIAARSTSDFDTQYLGRDHHFYVRPLEGRAWTIVAFRDKQPLRTLNLQVLLHWLLLLLVYGSIQSIVLSAILLPALRRHSAWLWPDKERIDLYRAALVLSAILSGLLALSVVLTSGWTLIVISTILPACGALLLKLTFEGKAKSVSKRLADLANRARLRPRSFRRSYVLVWASMLTLVGLLPSIAFFAAAYKVETTKFTKHSQMRIARSLEERTQRIERECKLLFPSGAGATPESVTNSSVREVKTRQLSRFLPGERLTAASVSQPVSLDSGANQPERDAARAELVTRRLAENFDDYSSFLLHTRIQSDTKPLPELDGGVPRLLADCIPLFDQTSAETLNLTDSQSADGSLFWRRAPDQTLWLRRKATDMRTTIVVASRPPVMLEGISSVYWLLMTPVFLLSVYFCHLISRFVAKRVMLLDIVDPVPLLPEPLGSTSISEHTLVLRRTEERNGIRWDEDLFATIDLRDFDGRYIQDRLKHLSTQAVVVDHLDYKAYDPDATMRKLLLIEALMCLNKTVIAVSTIDPLRFAIPVNGDMQVPDRAMAAAATGGSAVDQSASGAPPAGVFRSSASEAGCRERWVAILDKFVAVHVPQHGETIASDYSSDHQFYDSMRAGAQPWPYLEKIRGRIAQLDMPTTGSPDQKELNERLIEQVSEMARPYHIDIWENCSTEERIALFDLAGDGLINSSNLELKQLMRRGLVVRDPAPRLMDETFRRFVVTHARKEDLISLVRDSRGSRWQISKLPFLFILLAMAGFLLLTQPEMYGSTVTFVSTLSGGALTLFKLLDVFGKAKIANTLQS